MKHLLIGFIFVLLAACVGPGQRGAYSSIDVGGTAVSYRFQSCAPSFKWDGYKVEVEGLEFPNTNKANPLKFAVGKIGYEQKAIRSIKDSIARFDSMMQAACVTLVRLKEEKNILAYSERRDQLFTNLVAYLETLDKTSSQGVAEDEVKKTNEILDKSTVDVKTN